MVKTKLPPQFSRIIRLVTVLVGILFGVLVGIARGDKYALVIGIKGYKGFPKRPLKYADQDAKQFVEFIETDAGGGFPAKNVHFLINDDATRSRIYQEFAWLFDSVRAGDTVYVFFAGHGWRYHNIEYFMPSDGTEAQPDDKGIPMAEFFRKVTIDLQAKEVVVFIDACHAAAATEMSRGNTEHRVDVQKQWEEMTAKSGQVTMAIFSSQADQTSYEDPAIQHGLFSYYLLKGLKGGASPDSHGFIRAGDVFTYVRSKVQQHSEDPGKFPEIQTPITSNRFDNKYVLAWMEPSPIPPPLPPSPHVINPVDGLQYVHIPSGSFKMGCGAVSGVLCPNNELPMHTVSVSEFWMGKTEVTVEAYQRVAGSNMPSEPIFNPRWQRKSLPITLVDWDQAQKFCNQVNGRLPSEAEWEYAAHGGHDWTYPTGNVLHREDANFRVEVKRNDSDRSAKFPHPTYAMPVCSFSPNDFGLCDMAGNVMEWVGDDFKDYSSGSDSTASGDDDIKKVVRGGSWRSSMTEVRVTARISMPKSSFSDDVGFRCVLQPSALPSTDSPKENTPGQQKESSSAGPVSPR